MTKTQKDTLIGQVIKEIQFSRTYKQGKIRNWQKNEDMYYAKKVPSIESRANVDLGRMQEFVHTLLSKIDNPLIFKFVKQKDSQIRRVKRLNSLRQKDSQDGFWDLKDIAGKKQAIIYGRSIYSYYADSENGYCSHLDPVDVYDFLIDPSGGGIDIEAARFMGRYGVVKDKKDLKKGAKDGLYDKATVKLLIDGSGNAGEYSQEEINKRNRIYDNNIWLQSKEAPSTTSKYKFWEWFTTSDEDGERYYLLIDNGGNCLRMEKLKDIFSSNMWPFWTWAAFPDLTEFWTPSYADYVREIFYAQYVSINQMLDNSEQINKPQKVVNVAAIENLAELKYRREGYIKTKGDYDANRAIQILSTPQITAPIQVFNILELIQEKASGVTAGSKGVADADGKVGIYEGNQANTADRFGLLNKSYSFGYKRFAKLYEEGVREHLTKKMAIEILGAEGIEVEEISKSDIFYKKDKFSVSVEASDVELQLSEVEKKNKLTFLQAQSVNPIQNQKKAYEYSANIAGFTEEEIKELLDVDNYGNQELIAEAYRDIEDLMDGKQVKLNQNANIAYKQKFVDYIKDHQEDMTTFQFNRIVSYLASLEPIVIANSVRDMEMRMQQEGGSLYSEGADGASPTELSINPIDTTNGKPTGTTAGTNINPVQITGAQ